MINKNIKQMLLVLAYIVSGILFVWSVITDAWFLWILGLPFFTLIISIIHELGHVIGCVINKNKVTGIRTSLFTIENKHFTINEKVHFVSFCSFIKNVNNAWVYVCGPLASCVCFIVCLVWWINTRPEIVPLLCLLMTGFHVLRNGVPFGHNDSRLFIKELTKGELKK